ncbi:MAG: LysR family transcriptional regulator [Hyphomicrobiales bacterium]|nr:MAG: LysR family transcriptional regulator [Hyphomicrobiales bacterium]
MGLEDRILNCIVLGNLIVLICNIKLFNNTIALTGWNRMGKFNFLNTDFSALRTLHLVHELGSFTKAADRLKVNQSAISYTIEKLRSVFSDPLFVRQSGKIVATIRCNEIVLSTQKMLIEFEALLQLDEFDPNTANARFKISSNYYERQVLIPNIISKLRTVAPNMTLDLIAATSVGVNQIKSGEADILLGPYRPDENDLYCEELLREKYVCVMDHTHDLAKSRLTMAEYINASHLVINYGGSWRSPYVLQIEKMGIELKQVLTVPSPAGIDNMLLGTDLIATVPERVALGFGDAICIREMPIDVSFELNMVWTTRTHKSPLHRWMRNLVVNSIN